MTESATRQRPGAKGFKGCRQLRRDVSDPGHDWLTGLMEAVPFAWVPIVIVIAVLGRNPAANPVVTDLALQAQAAFLVATVAIVATIYVLQWNYFEHKPSTYEKLRAARHTLAVFWCEFTFVILALTALALISLAAVGLYPRVTALWIGWIVSAMFLLLVLAEIFTSIRAIWRLQGETTGQMSEPTKESYAGAAGSAPEQMPKLSSTLQDPKVARWIALIYSAFAFGTLVLAASQAYRSGLDEQQLSTFFSASLPVSGAFIVAIFLFAAEYRRILKERPQRELNSLAWWLICAFAITTSGLFLAVTGILHGFDAAWNPSFVISVLLTWAGASLILGGGVRGLMISKKEG